MRRQLLAFTVLAFLLAGSSFGNEEAEEPGLAVTVPLGISPVADEVVLLCNSDVKSGHWGIPTALIGWDAICHASLSTTAHFDKPYEFSVGGSKCSVEVDKPDKLMLRIDGVLQELRPRVSPLHSSVRGVGPFEVQLANGVPYMFCLPKAYANSLPSARFGVRSGSVFKGTLGGSEIAVYDSDFNGEYTTEGDCVRVVAPGRFDVYPPFSSTLMTKEGVYRIDALDPNGASLKATKVSAPLGTLKMRCSLPGTDVDVALGSADGGMNLVLSSTAGNEAAASVAAGRYRVLYGVLSQEGKAIAWVLAGESEGVVVRPGEEATLTLGVPSSLSFGITVFRRKTGRQLTIPASSLAVVGAGKEEYVAFKYNLKAPPAIVMEHAGAVVVEAHMKPG